MWNNFRLEIMFTIDLKVLEVQETSFAFQEKTGSKSESLCSQLEVDLLRENIIIDGKNISAHIREP